MEDTSLSAVYVDLDEHQFGLGAGARVGRVQFRKRPNDLTCHHAIVAFGKPERAGSAVVVSVVCLSCGHSWGSVKVVEPKGAK